MSYGGGFMPDTITVRLPKKLRQNLESLSRDEDIPVSDLVRDSLRRYIALRRFQKLRKQVLPFAEAQGLLTDEDIFREIK